MYPFPLGKLACRNITLGCNAEGRGEMIEWGVIREGDGVNAGYGGPVQITCSGVERNEFSTRLFATTTKMLLPVPVDHLAIIQACFTLSSRVLLVSNLRRSNWKCTVKRFFKSTVMRYHIMPVGAGTIDGGSQK